MIATVVQVRPCTNCQQEIDPGRIKLCEWFDPKLVPNYCQQCAEVNKTKFVYPVYCDDQQCAGCPKFVGWRRVLNVNTQNAMRKKVGEAPKTLKYCHDCSQKR